MAMAACDGSRLEVGLALMSRVAGADRVGEEEVCRSLS